jgi:hypothetical protein
MNDTASATNPDCEPRREPKLDGTFEQHQRLSLVADRLRLIAHAPSVWLSRAKLSRLQRHELEQFRNELLAHFAFEESGGYMAEISATRPELAPRIAGLQAEHALIASRIGQLADCTSRFDTRAAREALVALLELFDAHERAERDLLFDWSSRDLGAAG